MLVDSHCHLNFPEFKDDLPETIKRAWDQGIKVILTVNTKLSEAKDLQKIADTYSQVFCSVGVHPHDASDYAKPGLKERIMLLAKHKKVVALGKLD